MTLAGSISALLNAQWSLTGDLAKANLHFDTGWFDKEQLSKPQVIVSELAHPKGAHYGTSTIDFYPRYVVNCWVTIPRGTDGSGEYEDVEDLRQEVARVINSNRHGIPSFNIIVPDDEGKPLHELDSTPRILRYELTLFAVITRS